MLEQILSALRKRTGIQGWSVKHITKKGAQIYAVPEAVEAQREVRDERYVVNVLRCSDDSGGLRTCGVGNTTLLPGNDIEKALDLAALIASKVHNPPYSFPGPAEIPEVPLADSELQEGLPSALSDALVRIRESLTEYPSIHLAAAEGFAEETHIHMCNSLGIDSSQVGTTVDVEFVLHLQKGDRETESFFQLSRRRASDLPLEEEVKRHAQYTLDQLEASSPPAYTGAVVIRDESLAAFLNGGVIKFLSSAEAKFSKVTSWEIGKSIFRGDRIGDPLTVWANRMLPYGTISDRFDSDGLPAQKLLLIEAGYLSNFWATKRYADYLSLHPTGEFGNLELPPGRASAQSLLVEPYLEIAQFSWFNPDAITGDFASEIRFGYLVKGGRRIPIRGGMLVGNMIDALANVHWSTETGFYGSYQGPTTARFEELKVTAG